jgi:hypothetical protein
MMAPDFHSSAGLNLKRISQTGFPTTKPAASARSAIVRINQDDIAFWVENHGAKFPTRAIAGFCQQKALRDSDL